MENLNQIAVVGCGYWGKNLIRNFAALGALAAVCDNDDSAASAFSMEYRVPKLTFDEVLESNVSGVVIAAPAELHFKLAHKALGAGKNVYVEKPLALAVSEAEELCRIAERSGKLLMVGHLLQYHPGFKKLKEMVLNGILGKIQYIYSNRLSLGKIRREENSLWSFAPHDISMILSLVGEEPEKVSATGAAYLHEIIADVTMTRLKFPSGVQGHIFVSWLHPFKEQKLVVVGSEGMAVFDDGLDWDEKIQYYDHKIDFNAQGIPIASKAEPIRIKLINDEPLKVECMHFLDCIENMKKPLTDGYEGLRVLKVLQAAQASIDKERLN